MASKKKLKRKIKALQERNGYLWRIFVEERLKEPEAKLCFRGNACANPDHHALANCIMPVTKAQDPDKYAEAKAKDEEDARIVHDAFAKAGILAHWGHSTPHCDSGPVCNVCPWCDEVLPYSEINAHTRKHNQDASAKDDDSLVPFKEPEPIVIPGEYEIVPSITPDEGYVRFGEPKTYACCDHCRMAIEHDKDNHGAPCLHVACGQR